MRLWLWLNFMSYKRWLSWKDFLEPSISTSRNSNMCLNGRCCLKYVSFFSFCQYTRSLSWNCLCSRFQKLFSYYKNETWTSYQAQWLHSENLSSILIYTDL